MTLTLRNILVQVFQANTRALEVQQERTFGSVKPELRQASPSPLVGNTLPPI
jgi:hypothetical protein